MTTVINEEKTIALIDGTKVAVRPLKISLLREFMTKFEEIEKVAENNDKSITVLMECVAIAMKQYKPELAADLAALEDNLDIQAVYQIIDAASGINLADTAVLGSLVNN